MFDVSVFVSFTIRVKVDFSVIVSVKVRIRVFTLGLCFWLGKDWC